MIVAAPRERHQGSAVPPNRKGALLLPVGTLALLAAVFLVLAGIIDWLVWLLAAVMAGFSLSGSV
jgi:hypothetical protein